MKATHFITIILLVITDASAADRFPAFSRGPIHLRIPTNDTPGYLPDSDHESNGFLIYDFLGQAFTNPVDGHIQTLAEGFSGTTDKSTPWKTLTELLAAYQTGDIQKIRDLTDDPVFEKDMLDNPEHVALFKAYLATVVGMNVVIGFEYRNGFQAFVTVHCRDSTNRGVSGFLFLKTGSEYRVATTYHDDNHLENWNLSLYLDKHSIGSILNR